MAGWPTIETAESYVGTVNPQDLVFVNDCLDAAVDYLSKRVCLTVTNDDDDPGVPPVVAEAALILTGRLFRRRNTPDEFALAGGGIMAAPLLEGIETMISPYRAWGVA